MCAVYVYINNTHMHVYISDLFIYILYTFMYYINSMIINIDMYINVNIFKIYTACVYICIHNKSGM